MRRERESVKIIVNSKEEERKVGGRFHKYRSQLWKAAFNEENALLLFSRAAISAKKRACNVKVPIISEWLRVAYVVRPILISKVRM